MSDDISERLNRIEHQLDSMTRVLLALDQKVSGTPATQAVPPPIIPQAPQPVHIPVQRPLETISQLSHAEPPPPMPQHDRSAEFWIGSKLLPWVGSILVVLSIIFLVGWGFSNGWITPRMMFGGEVVLCLSFLGFGLKLSGKQEQFGQLLCGVGLAGLYLVLAGGNVVYHLYEGPPTVALTAAVSLGMLGLGWVRGWPSMWGLGIAGGLYSAYLPMDHGDFTIGAGLHLLIVTAGAALAAHMKRPGLAVMLWLGSLIGLAYTPDRFTSSDAFLELVLSDGIICVFAHLLASKDGEWTPLFPGFVMACLGIGAIKHDRPEFVLGFCGLMAAGSILASGAMRRKQFAMAAIAACLFTPWCYPWHERALALCGLGCAFAVLSMFRFKRTALVAAFLMLVDAIGNQYFAVSDIRFGPHSELGNRDLMAIGGLLLLVVLSLIAIVKNYEKKSDTRAPLAIGLQLVALVVVSDLISQTFHDKPDARFYISASWALFAAVSQTVGFRLKLSEFRYWGFFLMALTTMKVLILDLSGMDPGLRVAILLGLGLLMLSVGYVYVRQRTKPTAG